jgi:hypothetical protein
VDGQNADENSREAKGEAVRYRHDKVGWMKKRG